MQHHDYPIVEEDQLILPPLSPFIDPIDDTAFSIDFINNPPSFLANSPTATSFNETDSVVVQPDDYQLTEQQFNQLELEYERNARQLAVTSPFLCVRENDTALHLPTKHIDNLENNQSNGNSAAATNKWNEFIEDFGQQLRRLRNNQASRRSREIKKQNLAKMQTQIGEFEHRNFQMHRALGHLDATLRVNLERLCLSTPPKKEHNKQDSNWSVCAATESPLSSLSCEYEKMEKEEKWVEEQNQQQKQENGNVYSLTAEPANRLRFAHHIYSDYQNHHDDRRTPKNQPKLKRLL